MPWQVLKSDRFSEHAAAWDALQRASSDTPFLESTFLEPLLEVFGGGDERLALCHEDGQLRAAALLRPLGKGRWETFQPSQLPLGPWIAARPDDAGQRLTGLLRALPGFPLTLGLTQLDPKLTTRPEGTGTVATMDYVSTSWVDIDGSFDAYWDGRGKNLRQNTRKQRNKLQTENTETTLECVTDPDEVPAAIADYALLEGAGWKADTGTAILPDNAQGRFYIRMLQRFCALGRGRLYRYRFGDKVVAMDLCIDSGETVVILKTAYDESYRQVSPSTLMRQDQFRAWWDEGRYRRIEFYGKTLEWHTRWTEHSRVLYHATGYRWAWLARVQAARAARNAAAAATIAGA